MNENLRAEYEKYLARHGLRPRRLPSLRTREAAEREMVRIMYEEARSRDDPMAEMILASYERMRKSGHAETRHTATIMIESSAAEVEATIRSLPKFAEMFHHDVFVGEFPTGSINCATVKVDGGFLVLVNSGMISMLGQVVNFLWRGDPDDSDSIRSMQAADGVAEVLASYLRNGDPFYGPRPVNGGMIAIAVKCMVDAALKFVVAHEYGHVLLGHLSGTATETLPVNTEVGAIEALRKSHDQEFQADEIGYDLTLGVAREEFDLAVIDAARSDDRALLPATKQKSLIAAPFVSLAVDVVLEKFFAETAPAGNASRVRGTHPPAVERVVRLLKQRPSESNDHCSFINRPFMLLPSAERIVKRMTDRLLAASAETTESDSGTQEEFEASWLDDIISCVDAIRSVDARTAALVLADAFERQRTFLERDSDVVLRELVRATLGQTTNITETLLGRHRLRRALDAVIPDQQPKGLELVRTVLNEQTQTLASVPAEFNLVEAMIFAWQGERAQAMSSVRAALAAGVSDPDGRMARFASLETKALELDVRLDVQEMLSAVALRAVRGDTTAAREVAALVNAYTEYLGITLGPVDQRMIETQLRR
ncbi:hypothetical protein [Lentzea sp. NPDC004782]|uniref:hypothetical protein n=1 Tax=Lentzea sp. NPDC004782 TaxID=3154458 RepID=UPI0033A5DE41